MGEEIDRMIENRRRAIAFLVLFIIAIGLIIGVLIVMGLSDYGGSNSEFGQLEACGELKSKSYEVENFDTLLFFYDGFRAERTLFNDVLPNLKIVNSNEYRVEVKTNRELLEIFQVVNEKNMLAIGFESAYYGRVTSGDREYNGLYVECDAFEVTVYAPVSQLYTSAELTLDYQAPKTDFMRIDVSGEVQGKVYDIRAEQLECAVSGATELELLGTVSYGASIVAYHNSKVNAEQLFVPRVSIGTSSQIFGFSYIEGNGYSNYSFLSLGYVISWGLVLFVLATGGLFALFLVRYIKLKKQIDGVIAAIEAKGNFMAPPVGDTEACEKEEPGDGEKNLPNSEKTDENLLQNEE